MIQVFTFISVKSDIRAISVGAGCGVPSNSYFRRAFVQTLALVSLWIAGTMLSAQTPAQPPASSGSSSSQGSVSANPQQGRTTAAGTPRRGVETAGSAITLETNESLFDVAAGLNVCGYDADLDRALPVRQQIRDEMNQEMEASAPARDARDALCGYVTSHQLSGANNLSQYVSLAVYLSPPPELAPTVPETEMPPDANQVVNILPLLRTFAEQAHLHMIWGRHRAEYEAAVAQVHDPLTRTLLQTNIYLRQPVSSYDGRRFIVLLEPLLSTGVVNARIYGTDYFVVTSPAPVMADTAKNDGGVHLQDIRHSYLHYEVEPLVYARALATNRLQPLLKNVQEAPLEFTYKNDIVALVTECMIKAIEARTMDVGFPKPKKPENVKQRLQIEQYNQSLIEYERKADVVRRRLVDTDMHQGWVLTAYLYDKLGQMDRDGVSLKEDIGEMVYGMDVNHEQNSLKNMEFYSAGTSEILNRGLQKRSAPEGMDLAEMKLVQGDTNGAQAMAEKELETNPRSDEAMYVLARIDLLHSDPEKAVEHFNQVLTLSKDPRTLAWSHIYLGRLYDTQPDRPHALAEYQKALEVRDARPDTRAAAEKGIQQPFAGPRRTAKDSDEQDNEPLETTGQKQKDSYKPSPR